MLEVKVEVRWFVECLNCGSENDVDPNATGRDIECRSCGALFDYDNEGPVMPEDL